MSCAQRNEYHYATGSLLQRSEQWKENVTHSDVSPTNTPPHCVNCCMASLNISSKVGSRAGYRKVNQGGYRVLQILTFAVFLKSSSNLAISTPHLIADLMESSSCGRSRRSPRQTRRPLSLANLASIALPRFPIFLFRLGSSTHRAGNPTLPKRGRPSVR